MALNGLLTLSISTIFFLFVHGNSIELFQMVTQDPWHNALDTAIGKPSLLRLRNMYLSFISRERSRCCQEQVVQTNVVDIDVAQSLLRLESHGPAVLTLREHVGRLTPHRKVPPFNS